MLLPRFSRGAFARLGFVAIALALSVALAPAQAQSYTDSGGTIVPGVVIVDPTGHTGALGTSANPLHTTGGVGPSSSSATSIAPTVGGAAVSSLVLKASAGNFYGVTLTPTSAGYLFVINATSLPANGALTAGVATGNLQECLGSIPAGQPFAFSYGDGPTEYFSTGIVVAFSSTACPTLTASAVAFINGRAQ